MFRYIFLLLHLLFCRRKVLHSPIELPEGQIAMPPVPIHSGVIRVLLNTFVEDHDRIAVISRCSRTSAHHDERFSVLRDRKSTRLNSSHVAISYAVFCLKKKNNRYMMQQLPKKPSLHV